MALPTIEQEVNRYLRSGESDPSHASWSGDLLQRGQQGRHDLRAAPLGELKRLAAGKTHRPLPDAVTVALARRKVEPMVRGLFHRAEQAAVLDMLERWRGSVGSECTMPGGIQRGDDLLRLR